MFVGKRFLLTGARGYLGSAILEQLSTVECQVFAVDRQERIDWFPTGKAATISYIASDLKEPNCWRELPVGGVDYIIHLAAKEYDEARYDALADVEINALSLMRMLEETRSRQARPKILFVSSCNIFGAVSEDFVTEQSPDRPACLWSCHKLLAENYLQVYWYDHGIESVTPRLSNVYGIPPRRDVANRSALNRAIKACVEQGRLYLYANSGALRDYLYLDDAVRMLMATLTHFDTLKTYPKILIGSGTSNTMRDVWRTIGRLYREKTGNEAEIMVDNRGKMRTLANRNYAIGVDTFQRLTNCQAAHSIKVGISEVLDHYLGGGIGTDEE